MLQMSKCLGHLEGVVCQVDDILVFGRDRTEHDERLKAVMEHLKTAGVTLNERKCEFAVDQVNYLGHVVSADGIKPDPDKVKAILEMRQPTDVTSVRSLLGMANFLSKFIPHLSSKTKPLRDLLNKHNAWTWGSAQQHAFETLKSALASNKVLQLYDPTKKTVVSADASSYGLGAVIMQQQDDGEFQPIAFASRSLTEAESKYAQIEKEALAATWACERFNMYIQGKHFILETDHKPLVPLLTTKRLDDIPIRIQRFHMRLMRYYFDIVHVPGKQLIVADTLSRAPLAEADPGDLEPETIAYVNVIMESLPATERRLYEIKLQTEQDPILQQVLKYTKDGWPRIISEVPESIQPYWNYQKRPVSGKRRTTQRYQNPNTPQHAFGHPRTYTCSAPRHQQVSRTCQKFSMVARTQHASRRDGKIVQDMPKRENTSKRANDSYRIARTSLAESCRRPV